MWRKRKKKKPSKGPQSLCFNLGKIPGIAQIIDILLPVVIPNQVYFQCIRKINLASEERLASVKRRAPRKGRRRLCIRMKQRI